MHILIVVNVKQDLKKQMPQVLSQSLINEPLSRGFYMIQLDLEATSVPLRNSCPWIAWISVSVLEHSLLTCADSHEFSFLSIKKAWTWGHGFYQITRGLDIPLSCIAPLSEALCCQDTKVKMWTGQLEKWGKWQLTSEQLFGVSKTFSALSYWVFPPAWWGRGDRNYNHPHSRSRRNWALKRSNVYVRATENEWQDSVESKLLDRLDNCWLVPIRQDLH